MSIRVAVGVRGTFIRGVDAVGPEETREFRIALPGYPRGNILAPELTFADVAVRRWLRDSSGKLRELGEQEYPEFSEEKGAYNSIQEHPTLRIQGDEDRNGGRIIS
jgi:hypothetical protein